MKSTTRFHALASAISHCFTIIFALLSDDLCFLKLCLRPSVAVAAENLLLRKQLALYQERQLKPRRSNAVTRLAMVWLARWFNWKTALKIVQPQTSIGVVSSIN